MAAVPRAPDEGGAEERETLHSTPLLDTAGADSGFALRAGARFFEWFYSLPLMDHVVLNNYGYAPVSRDLRAARVGEPFQAQLYMEVVRSAPADAVPPFPNVLEVGCGRAGGLELVRRWCPHWRLTGFDCTPRAFLPAGGIGAPRHVLARAAGVVGDAVRLPFSRASFDVVLNVESSGSYDSVAQFFSEVARVLVPGARARARYCAVRSRLDACLAAPRRASRRALPVHGLPPAHARRRARHPGRPGGRGPVRDAGA